MAMEAHSNVDVYTLDKRPDGNCRGRHIESTFSNRLIKTDILRVITVPIKQICVDYYYMPNSWATGMGKRLFKENMRDFADVLSHDGCVYFPFHRDMLSALMDGEDTWQNRYDVSFARKDVPAEMEANLLFAGTKRISEDRMLNVYAKEAGQIEKYGVIPHSEIVELKRKYPQSNISLLLQAIGKEEMKTLRFIRLGKKQC
jgi:hypothetical protein